MITRRQYFAIMLIFVTVFILFQGLQIGKMYFSDSARNKHITESKYNFLSARKKTEPAEADVLPTDLSTDSSNKNTQMSYALFVGKKDTDLYNTAVEWAYFSNIALYHMNELPKKDLSPVPSFILMDQNAVMGSEILMQHYLQYGTNIVLMELPDVSYIESHNVIRMIIGLFAIKEKSQDIHGVRLHSGFFVGGERIFDIEDPADPEDLRQDLPLNIPWYRIRVGVETYMQGILNEDDLLEATKNNYKNEDMPAIVWRHHYKNGEVFSVNGEYMKNRRIGIGMLSAFVHQTQKYTLYPVVNARVYSMGNYPILTDENDSVIVNKYGSSLTRTEKDVVLPMLMSLSSTNDVKPSCFMSPKYDYNERLNPQKNELTYYLEMLFEMDGELGLSVMRKGSVSISEKLEDSEDYYKSEKQTYTIASAYLSADEFKDFSRQYKSSGTWKSMKTVVLSEYTDSYPLIGYINSTMTYQQSNMDLDYHTFTDELELMGVYTLLGYNNSTYDMATTFFPLAKRNDWQNTSVRLFSNLVTYNEPYKAFDALTSTECDSRIRSFLSLTYTQKRNGDTLYVSADNFDEHSYFVLRLHNEEIDDMSGGTYTKIEKEVYLLDIIENTAQIKLKSSLAHLIEIGGSR